MTRIALACALLALAGCASAASDGTPAPRAPTSAIEQIPMTAQKPDGAGPFPAVVIAHDCSGLGQGSSGAPARWARELVGQGYVVVIFDSFTTRGFPGGVCTDPRPGRTSVAPPARVRDAYAALAHARSLAYVDGQRVGLMGGSHGGSTTLASMLAPEGDGDAFAAEKRAGFAAGVALYPSCAPSGRTWANRSGVYRPIAPLLILIGEKDDWTPAAHCRTLADAARRDGHPVSLKVYPGAHHAFDSDRPVRYVATRINGHAPGGRGATTGGDPQAWADSIRTVLAFFAEHLKAAP